MVSRPPPPATRSPAGRSAAGSKRVPPSPGKSAPPPGKERPLPRRRNEKPQSWFRRNPELTTLGSILLFLAVVLLGPLLFWPAQWRLPGSRPPVVLDAPPFPNTSQTEGLRFPRRLPDAPSSTYPPKPPSGMGGMGAATGEEGGKKSQEASSQGKEAADSTSTEKNSSNSSSQSGTETPDSSAPVSRPQNRGRVVIIIDDMGIDRKRSARIAALPGPLTLSWLPYATNLTQQIPLARAAGHEMMIHMPMEPDGNEDPGPNALRLGNGNDENLRRLQQNLSAFEGYVGINNHMGSRFTADSAAMKPVMAELKRRNLIWVDSRTTPNSAGLGLAQAAGVPFLGRDVFLDHDPSAMAIRISLSRLEQLARQRGLAVGIGHPYDTTRNALADWLPSLAIRGLDLISVSAAVQWRAAQERAGASVNIAPTQPAVSDNSEKGFVLQGENP